MSKKLLSEAQVRRFQALATIKPLVEMESYNEAEEEEGGEELEMDAAPDLDMDAAEEGGEEFDVDAAEDEDMGDADVEIDEELVEKFMDAVSTIQQVADSLGGAAGEEMEMGPEEPMDMDAGEEAPLELDAGEEEPAEEDEEAIMEALKGISYVPSQKEVVKVVAKRVAKRLQEAKIAQRRLNRALGKK